MVDHPQFGKIYAYEVNGFGSYNLMDDANVPSLLSLPYLGAVKATDPVYLNTRKMLLSGNNPFFFKGSAAEGIVPRNNPFDAVTSVATSGGGWRRHPVGSGLARSSR